jgi:hypothetical protein
MFIKNLAASNGKRLTLYGSIGYLINYSDLNASYFDKLIFAHIFLQKSYGKSENINFID